MRMRPIYQKLVQRLPALATSVRRARRIWRKVRTRLSKSEKGTTGQAEVGSSPYVCSHCRAMDTYESWQYIARVLFAEAKALDLRLVRLPSETGTRFGMERPSDPGIIDKLIEALEAHSMVIERREIAIKNNLYEFDQVTASAPSTSVRYEIRREPHCSLGARYLNRRTVTLEENEGYEDLVVVPRPGRGPRVYERRAYESMAPREDQPHEPVTFDWPFPIDLVYTWVDADDPVWQEQRAKLAGQDIPSASPLASVNAARWYSRDELRFSLRSAWMYAGFVRKIFIVTNGQVPDWLEASPDVSVVTHDMLYEDLNDLPTFNSNHIETVLHRIPGLAEHFLYLNDDFFFASPAKPSDYFTRSGICHIFTSSRFLDQRPLTEHDRATVAAHKNTRDLIAAKLGHNVSQKFRHAPYVMRKSVWQEIDDLFGHELANTRHNRFRSWEDLNGQFLYCHYALLKGYGITAPISYKYLEVLDDDFELRLSELDDHKTQVFCLNDSNSTAENVDANSGLIATFFDSRFPVVPPWERGSTLFHTQQGIKEIELDSTNSLEYEVRQMGPDSAKKRYLALLEKQPRAAVAKKLMRLASNQEDVETALDSVNLAMSRDEARALARLDVLSKSGSSTSETMSLVPLGSEKDFERGLRYLARTIENREDFELFHEVMSHGLDAWKASPVVLARAAAAARRAGELEVAQDYLEAAAAEAVRHLGSRTNSRKRETERLSDPWVVVDDLLEVAIRAKAMVFADAGTLLGFVREGDFLTHDYDIDFACRSDGQFEALRAALEADWRFDVSRVRTPDRLLQARHVNGTLLDVFRHIRAENGWVKTSHVYGWRFDDFEIETLKIGSRSISVPSPAEKYLEQMYGPDWRVPQTGFDSRLYAPNCFFPDRRELICTMLNRIVNSALLGNTTDVDRSVTFLRKELGYVAPNVNAKSDMSEV